MSIAEVYDPLRNSKGVYRERRRSERIEIIMVQKDRSAFNGSMLRRFVNLTKLLPVGTAAGLMTVQIAVVGHERPSDAFRPLATLVREPDGRDLEEMRLIDTWNTDVCGHSRDADEEAIDPESMALDALPYI